MLRAFANHAALALERAQLVELALRSEVLEEVDAFRHAVMGSVSHDLRTPLATMKVASSALRDADARLDAVEVDELHALLDEETDRLSRLVSGLLDLNRFDAGVLELHREPTSASDLVSGVLDDLRSSLAGRAVAVDVPADLPPVAVDRVLAGLALANLVDNADRYAPDGTAIAVAAREEGDEVVLSVTDAGAGVPPDERHDVFDRFVRFDTGGRAGLGLWVAKTFVDAHHGRIWVDDRPAGGACFCVALPVAHAPAVAGVHG
jgi:two-component system sensor histidine kinase KdpD